MRCFILFLTSLLLFQTACLVHKPRNTFDPSSTPPAPDYSLKSNWAARPEVRDLADSVPCTGAKDMQSIADIDVFYIHPTTLTGSKKGESMWNADTRNRGLNKKTEESPILYQASIFNGVGRIFAPRYRQAHLHSFYSRDTISGNRALDTAYADVVAAFDYYLKYENQGRPFILAGHSQGARHGMYLLRDHIESKNLARRMVVAYLIGWPIPKDFFKDTPACERPEQTGCFCSWRTWKRKYALKHAFETNILCTNPLSWTIKEGQYVGKEKNKGAVLLNFCNVLPQVADAEVYKGVLLCTKPKFPGSAFFIRNNYHVGDMNLYYMNIRENAELRMRAFWK